MSAVAWFAAGGPVMWPLLAVGLTLYALALERALALYSAAPRSLGQLEADKGLTILRALVAAAPLLGLLGTVGGMIGTFDGLVGGARLSAVAEGVGHALRTTQYGLAIAAPGLVVERMLSRRAEVVRGLEGA